MVNSKEILRKKIEKKKSLIFTFKEEFSTSFDFTFYTNIRIKTNYVHPLTFNFYSKDNIMCYTFSTEKIENNVWQAMLVPYRDMTKFSKKDVAYVEIISQEDIDIEITYPQNIHFDERYVTPDYALPFVNLKSFNEINKNWIALLKYQNELYKYIFEVQRKAISIEADQSKILFDKLKKVYRPVKLMSSTEIKKEFESIDFSKGISTKYFNKSGLEMRYIGNLMLQMGQKIDEFEKEYLTLFRYIYINGFREGSNFSTADHLGYETREIFQSFIYTKDLLEKENEKAHATGMATWYNGLGRVLSLPVTEVNIDILNTQITGMLIAALYFDNKVLLNYFTKWLEQNLNSSNGILGGFKEDTSMFHHCQHYVLYGVDALKNLIPIVYVLDNTNYSISKKSFKNLENIVRNLKVYTHNDFVPNVLSGRHPDESYKLDTTMYKYYDIELEDKDYLFPMHYAGMLVKRTKNGTILLLKGFSRYIVGNEAYTNKNLYGRYGMYGRYEIIPKNLEDRGYRFDNFNFSHFDGTTSFKKEKNELLSTLNRLPAAGVEEMLLSTEKFLCVDSMQDKVGIFAMKLRGHSKYNEDGLYARKSYTVIGNTIVAIGSGISKGVVTTVFQNVHFDKKLKDEMNIKGTTYYINSKKAKLENNIVYFEHNENNSKYDYVFTLDNSKKEEFKILKNTKAHHIVQSKEYITYAIFDEKEKINSETIEQTDFRGTIIEKRSHNKLVLSLVHEDLGLYEGMEEDQVDSDGRQIEVSIYSRKWLNKEPKLHSSTITLFGEYECKKANYMHINGKTIIEVSLYNSKHTKLVLTKK